MLGKGLYLGIVAVGIAAFLASLPSQLSSQQSTGVAIDNDDIGGVVTSAKGPEAGRLGDRGNHGSSHQVRQNGGHRRSRALRGAGFAQSQLQHLGARLRVGRFAEGQSQRQARFLNLKAVVAPNEAAAAQYYPAIYWYSMLKIPDASEFGGKGKIPAKVPRPSG